MTQPIYDGQNNIRSTLLRRHKKGDTYTGVDDAVIARFLDGGHASDQDLATLTKLLLPGYTFDATHDRLLPTKVTFNIPDARNYLARLVSNCRDKSELARATGISLVKLDGFSSQGKKTLTPAELTAIAHAFGIAREYREASNELVPLPATASPAVTPPDYVGKPWRDQKVPTMPTVD